MSQDNNPNNANNLSDYNTPSTDLFELLPAPYRSDTNRAVFSNLFNRYLSKSEVVQVIGYIGDGNSNAIRTRQIVEPTVHRQGYQLQPLLYEKIGSIEYITSWEDIENELTAQGVNINDQASWNNATIFNWAPPVDINKLVNYQDYYWVDTVNPTSRPQYITVKSECTAATALVDFFQSLINMYGATFNIVALAPATNTIFISGNFTQLFQTGFVFYIENSTNVDLGNSFQTVASSTFNTATNQTAIVITTAFTDATTNGDITLNEQLMQYQGIQSCKCSGSLGWDTSGWDDNQTTPPPPLWNAAVIAAIEFPTLAAWNIANPVAEQYDIWWDTTTDTLYSLQNVTNPTNITSWKAVYQNFSMLVQSTTGTSAWDLTTGCTSEAVIAGLDQWITQNNWFHKDDVTNFTIAQRAQAPIIEFEPNLELNEWTQTTYTWQYRSSNLQQFATTTAQPTRFELEPINLYTSSGNTIIIDERFGDLTNIFVPGFTFSIAGLGSAWTVASSTYQRSSLPLGAFQTNVVLTAVLPVLVPATNYLYPQTTSQGDPFQGYGQQWLFIGINTTTAINHQDENNMMDPTGQPSVVDVSGDFSYQLAPYAELFTVLETGLTTLPLSTALPAGSTRSLQQRSLVGFDDIRVYLNGVRQYGTYDEVGTTYVTGITLHTPLIAQDQVLVEVGEAAFSDFGNYAVAVRTIADNTQYAEFGNTLVSLVQMRLVEQIKTATNQYPLFDIYLTNSTPADIANEIFGYHDDPSGILYPYLSQRVVTRADGSLEFQNFLVQTNNGMMYAYRNYNKLVNSYWFNPSTQQLLVWDGETWSTKYEASGYYSAPLVLSALPDPVTTPLGFLVFNTSNNTLYERTNVPANWITLSVFISTTDQTLETVWRHGLNDEQFVPAQVDWLRRSYPVYQDQYNAYITTQTQQILMQNPALTPTEAQAQANTQWTAMQDNYIQQEWYSVPGTVRQGPLWCGEWQVPDTLYYNVSHEDYQYVSTRDVLTHFQSIVDAQPLVPGFNGQPSANWNLIDYTQINWGLGGTIHEYDNSFDTFLSAEFINTVTPPSLFSFAQSEYENILVTLSQLFQRNAVAYLTAVDTNTILNPGSVISNDVITSYEENEAANLVYGDSTTFQQATLTSPASGIENWIATLPYFGIVPKTVPYADIDTDRGINAVYHHDGHYANYSIPATTINALQTEICNTVDPRFPTENLGRISLNPPPATQAQFISQFSANLRTGVYWLNNSTNTLYRMVAFVQTTAPALTYTNGTLWWNTTGIGSLYVLENGVWNLAPFYTAGNLSNNTGTHTAWQVINLSQLLVDVVVSAETLLYQQAPPTPVNPVVNFAAIEASNPTLWNQLLQQQFTNYTIAAQIATPFANNTFDATNPFTWNYKYSTTTLPPHSGTIATGGTWQDVYQKAYGTPYPELEPWLLQGYVQKPTWWDATFANNNEDAYGLRRWAYRHALPINSAAGNTLEVGNFGDPNNTFIAAIFNSFDAFTVYTPSANFTYNISGTASVVAGFVQVNTVQALDPSITGGDSIAIGMWDYVIRGATPNSEAPPPTTAPAYSYVSVNIQDPFEPQFQPFVDGSLTYNSDDVFPPYWNFTAHASQLTLPQDRYVRSIYSDTTFEVIDENADYVFGDSGPIEWAWRNSTFYLYSLLTIAYLIQPVRTIQQTFGVNFEYIDGLPIDSLTGQVFSHENTQFHGEISAVTNQVIRVNGINQWYVNYNRANGYDASYSDFRAMWTGWTAPLSHLFAATIDTSSFSIDQRVVEITPADYELTMKRSPGVSNTWIDAFNVRIESIPPIQTLYDTQAQWIFELDSLAPIARTISYYDVKLYDYYVNPTNSVCSLYTYPIVAASILQNSFTVDGDVSGVFGGLSGATQFVVTGSPGNNGTYTIVSATYDDVAQQTTIVVTGPVLSLVAGGLLAAINYRTLPWVTGDLVAIATTEIAPIPLDITLQYFVIVISPTTFMFAYTAADALASIPILFTTLAYGIQRVGQLYGTFQALNGQTTTTQWSHYVVDNTIIKQFSTPYTLSGMQNLINILDGYAAYTTAQGFGINVTGAFLDPQTGQQVSWQNEIERFINWAYTQRTVRRQRQNDKYAVDINYTNSQLTYTSQNPGFPTGYPVVVVGFGGALPPPLMVGFTYYVINNGATVQLASSRSNALAGTPITISYIGGVGQLYLSSLQLYLQELPTYEINPFRNALWYSPPEGIVSNLLTGPYVDINSQQLLFDQYGRKLAPSDIRVFRQDKQTEIQFAGGVYNDMIAIQQSQQNPYLYLHLGGGNIYIDTYEHVIIFNNYTVAGALIYDPFLGVNVTKWELDYYKQDTFTERPNVGGYFLSTNYNQGANIDRNIEASVSDVRYMYDTYQIPETLPAVQQARLLLDYPGSINYLQEINLTPKSQFLFWLGSLHYKGSQNAITAFVNSIRFVSANVDEFWAYKVADFGSAAEQEYLSLLLQITDTQTNDLRLEFVRTDEVCMPGYAVDTFGDENCGYANPQAGSEITYNVDPTFIPIATTDQTRWWNQPDQMQTLVPDGGVLYFSLKAQQKLVIYPVTLGPNTFIPYGDSVVTDPTSPLFPANLTDETAVIVFDATNNQLEPAQQNPYTFWYWNPANNGYWVYGGGWDPTSLTEPLPILRHDFKADEVQMTFNWYGDGFQTSYTVAALPAGVKELTINPYLPLTNSLQVFENEVLLVSGTDYVESLEQFPGSTILGYKLYFQNSISGSTLDVVYGPSQLNSELQFQTINTNIVQLLSQEIITHMFANDFVLTLWGLETDKETQNPAKIIDMDAEVVLSPVSFWDPARGYQYYQSLHSIDIQSTLDPAIYDTLYGWKNQELGKTWMDTTNVQYLPYYDPYVITDQNARLDDWGQLTDYGNVRIFQWVASPVPPDQYNALAATQENDNTIDPSIRLSGIIRQDVRYRTRANTEATVVSSTQGETIIQLASLAVLTDLTGLAPAIISPVDPLYSVTVLVDGTKSRTIDLHGSVISTYGDLVTQLNTQLSSVGATTSLVGDDLVITSSSTGPNSSVAIDITNDGMFTSLTNYSALSASTSGTAATVGYQDINLSSAANTDTVTGLPYTPGSTSADNQYEISIFTTTLVNTAYAGATSYSQITETRQAYGSQVGTFTELIKFLESFKNITVTTGVDTITLTNVAIAANDPDYPSIVSIAFDSLFQAIPTFSTITSNPSNSGYGNVVITFTSAISGSTGLAPVTIAEVNASYSFNVSINGGVNRTVTITASQAQTYGDLVTAVLAQLSSLGAGIQLIGDVLQISSDTAGTTSSIAITTDTLFPALTLYSSTGPSVAGTALTSGTQSVITTLALYDDLVTGLAASSPTQPSYGFTITVDGTFSRTLTYLADQVATYQELITLLSTQFAVYGATISLDGTQIVITSNTIGSGSSLTITSDTLFSSITTSNGGSTSFVSNTPVSGMEQTLSVLSTSGFVVGNTVLFSSTGTLPTGIIASTPYTITGITGLIITINTTITSAGTGVLTMANAVWPTVWTLDEQIQSDLDPLIDAVSSTVSNGVITYTFNLSNCLDPLQDYAVPVFAQNDAVNIYVDGVFNQAYTLTTAPYAVSLPLNEADRVTVILPIHVPTATELAFNPAVADDGTIQIQYQYITNYNAVQTVDTITQQNVFTYYFWVEDVTTATGDREPPVNAIADLITPPQPYMFFNKLEPAQVVVNSQNNQNILVPDRFTQAIIRGLRGYVDTNDRYVLRFTRDFTLRDNLAFGTSPLQLKDAHQEWLMFRKDQLGNIPQELWDNITSSIVGYDINNPSVRVPALNRQLYDATYGTSTQYGLGEGQTFVNGVLAQATILAYLTDPTNNFYPIDMDEFFATYNFDTAANTIATMSEIYTTFSYTNVNNMYFSVLQDALSTQLQYAGLMKTSAVALYGVELLNVSNVFDD